MSTSYKVLVVGDLILDRYVRCAASKLCPEGPVPAVRRVEEGVELGAAGNLALNLMRLGCDVRLVSALGSDRWGDKAYDLLGRVKGLEAYVARWTTYQTVVKTRFYADNQLLLRVDDQQWRYEPCNDELHEVVDHTSLLSEGADAVCITDYNKGVVTQELLRFMSMFSKLKVLDPYVGRYYRPTKGAIVCPNQAEWETLKRNCWPGLAFVSKGKLGLELRENGSMTYSVQAKTQRPVCVTGAGDVVTAAVTVGMLQKRRLTDIIDWANELAGAAVLRNGNCVIEDGV